ncbi:MAG: EAL domain-containing protein [Clostridiales bacterium]|nr:EAL domain-containing protein [Clostridiales bacterium]
MNHKYKLKFSVPRVLADIDNSTETNEYSRNFDKLFCMFMSPLLFVSAVGIIVLGILVFRRPVPELIFDACFMLAFAVFYEILLRTNVRQAIRHHLVSVFYSIIFLFSVWRYYPIVGPALWTFAFIQIVLSLSQNSQFMLIHSAITVALAGVYVSFFQAPTSFGTNTYYIGTQFVLFALLYLVSKAVYEINLRHINKLREQLIRLRSEMAQRKIAEDKNAHFAMYDQLTGLPNRTLFLDRLNQSLEFSERNHLELYVLFIDIDLFKLINDTLGHSSGDELLIAIGDRLTGMLRSSDAVCRVSGDEFLLMLQDVKDGNHLHKVTERILDRIHMPYTINKRHVTVSCSIGISKFPENGQDAESLIKYADIAMYKAKQDGKNRFAIYSEDLEQLRRNEMEIVSALQKALNNNEFRLHYQPQINANTNEVIGFEALIRWEHPQKGLLGAMEVIPAAEKSGLIVPIGEWVLKTACRQNKAWQDSGMKPVPIAVNISISQITSNNLFELVKNTLLETGLEAKYLELEITETTLVKEITTVNKVLTMIRGLGVKFAIDDFGTGYSAIQYLKSFPIDRIKIPMNFIHGINNNTKDESIITVILALAESLGINVVAEGVETERQLSFLMNRLCYNIQGYFFCKPMAAEDIEEYVKNKSNP